MHLPPASVSPSPCTTLARTNRPLPPTAATPLHHNNCYITRRTLKSIATALHRQILTYP